MGYSREFLDKHREINVDYDWWGSIYDDFHEICTILGIELYDDREPCFTGFWSQGDGASWTGHYRAIKYVPVKAEVIHIYDEAPIKIRAHAPEDDALHGIADRLCMLNRLYTPFCARVTRSSSHYVHDCTMQIYSWEFYDDERNEDVPSEIAEHMENELTDIFRDLARWLYKTLEHEYDHLTSDEAVAETLEANEIEEEEDEECSDCV